MRQASVERNTKETRISASVDLDGTGKYDVSSGIGFLDHMMEQLSRHSLIDLTLLAQGDLHIDFHHTTEDTGYALGEAVSRALGDRLYKRDGSRPPEAQKIVAVPDVVCEELEPRRDEFVAIARRRGRRGRS